MFILLLFQLLVRLVVSNGSAAAAAAAGGTEGCSISINTQYANNYKHNHRRKTPEQSTSPAQPPKYPDKAYVFAGLFFVDLGVGCHSPAFSSSQILASSFTDFEGRGAGLSLSGVFGADDRNNFYLKLWGFNDFSTSPVRAAATAASSPGAVPPNMSKAEVPRLKISIPADFQVRCEIVESDFPRETLSTIRSHCVSEIIEPHILPAPRTVGVEVAEGYGSRLPTDVHI